MKRLIISILIIAALLASGCISDKDATTEEPTENISQMDAVPLIPREVFFGNDKITPYLSPDGTQISYLAPVDGVMNVWVGPADDPDSAEPVTNDTDRGISSYFWAYTNEHILYTQDKAGEENWRVYSVTLETGETIDLTPFEGVQASIQAVSQEFPDEILIALNDRDPALHDIHRLNITTGEKSLVMENEGFLEFSTDDDYNVRFAERFTSNGGKEILKATETGGWEPFMEIAMEDSYTTAITGFDKTRTILHMTDSRDRNTVAFSTLDITTGEQTLIAEDSRADVSDSMIHPIEKTIQAVAFTYERKHWQIIDESIAGDLAYLKTVDDGDVEVVSRTLDDKYWIVAYLMDDGPVRYYRYDHEENQAEFLFTHKKALEDLPLAKMHPAVIKSRDGLDLVSYYTLPVGSDSDSNGRPDEPLPMVLHVHGGPWGRDYWGYDPFHQWLANRGYAVLSVNFRGSTGFGKEFTNAGNLEWGGKMHDDLIDAVDWAVLEGIADPDRVAIMGGSYGGYATLWGMTNTPDKFACGQEIFGMTNLTSLLETIPPYFEPMIELLTTRIGDHRTEEGRALLTERSPLLYADQIEKPLLIAQGANDPRVKQAEADKIVQAMQDANIPVTYLLYTDEGHGFERPENILSLYAVTDVFFAEHLGGRYEPIGDDFEGSSITVPVGAEEVPGLAEAIAD
ncbi:MAG: S9 family peptidase [ANME-2 cluster archaeon]|nr:S9 family peptidase [ANME-2 cluster archaeon]